LLIKIFIVLYTKSVQLDFLQSLVDNVAVVVVVVGEAEQLQVVWGKADNLLVVVVKVE
jgi:hypothetical protein